MQYPPPRSTLIHEDTLSTSLASQMKEVVDADEQIKLHVKSL